VIVSLGEALVDLVSQGPGASETFVKMAGGAPFNVACGVAKLGEPAAFIGRVGDDAFGRFLLSVARDHGVETSGMLKGGAATALAVVSIDAAGERSFAFYGAPAAHELLAPADLPEALLGHARIFHFGSISLSREPAASATRSAIAKARAAGAIISFDPNLRPTFWPSLDHARTAILQAMAEVDVVKVAREELSFLASGASPEAEAMSLLARGPKVIVVTDGQNGVTLYRANARPVVESARRVRVVDTTGAGDAFVAGFLARLAGAGATPHDLAAEAGPLAEALRWGCAAGALCCTERGAITALPTRAQLQQLLGP
jgi:fructokinase